MIYDENSNPKVCDTKDCNQWAAFRTLNECLCWTCYSTWCKRLSVQSERGMLAQIDSYVKPVQLKLF